MRDPILQALGKLYPNAELYLLNSRALENAGYLPGDLLVVDRNAAVRSRDVVIARVSDAQQTLLLPRIFNGYDILTAATNQQSLADPWRADRRSIIGAVVASFRGELAREPESTVRNNAA